MRNLVKVMMFLQQNDSNGSYTDVLDEIADGDKTVEEVKEEFKEVLILWYNENTTEADTHQRKVITHMLGLLKGE